MSKKLKYKIISCSSQEPQFPSSQLLFGGQNGGWQTRRFCTYPQQVTFQFYGPVKIQKIEIISDNRKVPSQVDILFYLPFESNGRQSEQRFLKYGYLNFNRNQNSQLREQKSIMVDIKCLYLRFLIHKPHQSKQNFFSQIGIQQISVYGTDLGSTFAPVQRLPRQIGQVGNGGYGMANGLQEDPFVAQKLALLNSQKQRAVQSQDFESANEYKMIIDTVKKAGDQLRKLHLQKRMAIEEQDYEKANTLKKSIQKHRKQLDELISFNYDDNVQQNEFVEYGNNTMKKSRDQQFSNNNNMNDFQDNEFVDPQMNDMIEKSGVFSNRGQNSRVINNGNSGNSRIIINKSLLKKQLNTSNKQKQNYDDRVIPTLMANNSNKQKNSQEELNELQNNSQTDKKLQLKLEQVEGKNIQYSMIMADHFDQDTIKKFFSQHWQYKVQALGIILTEAKKKALPDASFVKALLTVVKNSVTETNFQVSLNSLQVFQDMMRINAKSNLVSRSNEINNDLDSISKQIVKKISDNNNKLRQQAEKSLTEMVTSSLYGPQVCTIALTKIKDKVKLSTKQLMSRLNEVKKIVQKYSTNNPQVINLGAEFAIEHVKNPAVEVRNEAVGLLLVCRDNDQTGTVQKRISEKNFSEIIQNYESKAGQKLSKSKKLK